MALPSLQEREQFVVSELSKRGYQPHKIAAIAGSIRQESTFDPGIKEQGGTGLGLFQWSHDRRGKVPALTGDFRSDARNQLNLFEQELQGPEKKAGEMLKGAKDLQGAAAAMKQFERYGEAGSRYDYMRKYYDDLKGGKLTAQGGEQAGSGQSSGFSDTLADIEMPAARTRAATGASAADGVGAGLIASALVGGGSRYAGSDDFITAAAQVLGSGAPKSAAQVAIPSFEMSPSQAQPTSAGDGETLQAGDFGRKLQAFGFKVAENPEFGAVGKHSPNSHHYSGDAFDLTIQPGSPLLKGKPDSEWKSLTKQYGEALRQALPGAEIFHPGHDPVGGHDSHIHLAVPGISKSGVRMNPRLQKLLAMAG